MAWSNFAISAVVVGSAIYLMKTDVRAGSAMLRQNLKTIRTWMSEEANAIKSEAQKQVEAPKPKTGSTPQDPPKPSTP